MRKNLLLILLFLFIVFQNVSFADEWDSYGPLDNAWDKPSEFTNQDYQNVVDLLEQRKQQKEVKKKKRLFKKISGGGTSLHKDLNPEKEIKELNFSNDKEEGLLLNVPVNLVLGNDILEKGYYKVTAEKDEENNIKINFYQSQYLKGTLIADETEDDYGQDKIDFIEILPFNESHLKLIFGSLDFNAYAYVNFLQEK